MTSERGTTLDDLHLAMGRFLTESSSVESMMGTFVTLAPPFGETMQDAFVDYMGKTFGQKISAFKRACDSYTFGTVHRDILDEIYPALEALLPKRNFIVHGSTYQMAVGDGPSQSYRIGMQKGRPQFP